MVPGDLDVERFRHRTAAPFQVIDGKPAEGFRVREHEIGALVLLTPPLVETDPAPGQDVRASAQICQLWRG